MKKRKRFEIIKEEKIKGRNENWKKKRRGFIKWVRKVGRYGDNNKRKDGNWCEKRDGRLE